jgi:hypothetical protein
MQRRKGFFKPFAVKFYLKIVWSYDKISSFGVFRKKLINQPTFFEPNQAETEKIILYALGDFQSRKKVLAERELALDRLRGAFKRACEKFGTEEISDEKLAEVLEKLGAKVVKLPSFVAKHPFRVTVSNGLAEKSSEFYKTANKP